MRICFLSSAHPPLDKRVFTKEAVCLAEAGFDVIHVAPDSKQAEWILDGVKLSTYVKPKGMVGRALQLRSLYARARAVAADCYHCNEVDSWLVGLMLKLRHGKRVVFDVHEHYPSTFAAVHLPGWMRPVVGPMVGSAIRLLLRTLAPFTDRIVLAKRTVAPDLGRTESRQVLVQNFAPVHLLGNGLVSGPRSAHQKGEGDRSSDDGPPVAVHLGVIGRPRGWPQLLDALTRMRHQELRVLVIGAFNDDSRPAFERRVQELGLQERVTMEEWMPIEQAFERMLTATVGLILFQPGIQNHVYASPHKLFDYMLAGLPVVAPAFAKEVASVVEESQCGLLVDPADPQAIADALDALLDDPEQRRRLAENGRKAVRERYNWEQEGARLVAMYRAMEEGRAPGP